MAFSFLPSSKKSTCITLHLQSILHFVVVFVQLLSCVWLFENPWITAGQALLSSNISQSLFKFMSIELVMLPNRLILYYLLLLLPSIFPSMSLFQWVSSSHQVAKVLELLINIQGWFPLGLIALISLQSKGLSRESSPTPQFKSLNSSALNLLYGSTLTSIPDYWKNHSFDYMDLCWQSGVSAF